MNDVDAPVVRLVGLTKTFGAVRGISNVTLDVTAGQAFGFLGPNGAGKSTTIRLMMGLYLPTAGRAELFGLDARRHGPQLRRRVGYLPGELALHPRLTGGETLDRTARMRGDVDPALRARLERRFGAELDRPVRALSKGNRQKIGLIQAFMHDPELLVLDEPTSGLDPLLQKEFADLLRGVRGPRAAPYSCPPTTSTRCSGWPIGSRSSGRASWLPPTPWRACGVRAPRTVELTFRDAR